MYEGRVSDGWLIAMTHIKRMNALQVNEGRISNGGLPAFTHMQRMNALEVSEGP